MRFQKICDIIYAVLCGYIKENGMDFSQCTAFPAESVSASDIFYSLGSDCLVIRRFTPSRLDTDTVSLAQDRMPSGEAVLFFESSYFGDLALMISDDSDCSTIPDGLNVTVGGFEYECAVNHGYLLISGPFESGCRIMLSHTPDIAAEDTSDTDSDTSDVPAAEDVTPDTADIADTTDSIDTDSASDADSDASDVPAAEDVTPDTADTSDTTDSINTDSASDADSDASDNTDTDNASGADADTTDDISSVDPDIREIRADIDRPEVTEDIEDIREITADTDTPEKHDEFDRLVAGAYTVGELIDEAAAITLDGSSDSCAPQTLNPTGFEEASVFYNASMRRYLLKIRNSNGAHAILPDGTEISAAAGKSAFTGYRMEADGQEYDLVIMKEDALKDDNKRCHAYMDVVGSFPGDCCYFIDGVNNPGGTHGHIPGQSMIDRDTGYRWGCPSPAAYEFELENGLYTVETVKAYADDMTVSERDAQKVSGGYLRLFGSDYISIRIVAADTISQSSRYEAVECGTTARCAARIFIPDTCSVPILDAVKAAPANENNAVSDNTAASPCFTTPTFEHVDAPSVAAPASTGIKKADVQADNYDFAPLSGDKVVSYTPYEEDDDDIESVPEKEQAQSDDTAETKPVKNITVSVYSPEQTGITDPDSSTATPKTAHKASDKANAVSRHVSVKLAKRKVDNATLVAGVAAGTIAVISGLAKLLSGKKRR